MKRVLFLNLIIINLSFANIFEYINSIRLHSGVGILKYSKTLSYAAKKHAIYLKTNKEFGHSENRYKRDFFGVMPWNRILKAGFGSKAVVENISFGERSYRASVDKIMATVYHRLAFLDTKVDSLGFGMFGNIYVYDMGNSKISYLCKQSFSKSYSVMQNLCNDRYKQLPRELFTRAINSTKSHSKRIVVYPYNNQKGVSTSLVDERPKFTYKRGYGLPISVSFNNYYYRKVTIKKFELKTGNRVVDSKIVTFRNDRAKKLKENDFILLPLQKLQHHTKYRVVLKAIADGKVKVFNWVFTTR